MVTLEQVLLALQELASAGKRSWCGAAAASIAAKAKEKFAYKRAGRTPSGEADCTLVQLLEAGEPPPDASALAALFAWAVALPQMRDVEGLMFYGNSVLAADVLAFAEQHGARRLLEVLKIGTAASKACQE